MARCIDQVIVEEMDHRGGVRAFQNAGNVNNPHFAIEYQNYVNLQYKKDTVSKLRWVVFALRPIGIALGANDTE